MNAKRKLISLNYGNFSYGMRLSTAQHKLYEQEVNFAQDCILQDSGCYFCPGHQDSEVPITAKVSGMHLFKTFDNTEIPLIVSGGNLYTVSTSAKTKTLLFNIGSTSNAYFIDYLGKCFVTANGGTPCKVEYNTVTKAVTAYRIGIQKPTAITGAVTSGGSLDAGVYLVYGAYGRVSDSSIVLYSDATLVGTITLTAGNQSINITSFPNSSDGQVNDKIIFATLAGGDTPYYLYHTNNNTTTSFTISDATQRNTAILMQTVSADYIPMPSCEYIFAFNGRLWGSTKNELYYSEQDISNVWDMDKFKAINKTTYPFLINGIYGLGEDLFLSTKQGMIKQPQANPDTQLDIVDPKFYFYEMNTVCPDAGVLWGLTNDGVRYFDGREFSNNWSEMVQYEVNKIYNTTSSQLPAGFIKTRHKVLTDDNSVITQKEYHLSYNDDSLSINHNNRRLVLDLNSLMNPQRNESRPPDEPRHFNIAKWVIWQIGFNYADVSSTETPYMLQQHLSTPLLILENDGNLNNLCILSNGTIQTALGSFPQMRIITRALLVPLTDKVFLKTVLAYYKTNGCFSIGFYSMESTTAKAVAMCETGSLSGGQIVFQWDVADAGWDEGYWQSEIRRLSKSYIGVGSQGSAIYLIITANNGLSNFGIEKINVLGVLNSHRLVRSL